MIICILLKLEQGLAYLNIKVQETCEFSEIIIVTYRIQQILLSFQTLTYNQISMMQAITGIIIILLTCTESILYHPLQTPNLSQNNIYQFLSFNDQIILSPNKTIIVHRVKTTSSSTGTLFFLRMIYYLADNEQKILGVQDIFFLDTGVPMPIDDIRTAWLEPDRLIFFSACMIQVVDVNINITSFAQKLDNPEGINCIVSKSFIDWEDKNLSTFYAIDRVYYELWNYTQDSIVKLTLDDKLSLVNMNPIKNYRFYSSSTFRLGDYFCFITELKNLVIQPPKDNLIYCFSLDEDNQITVTAQIVSSDEQIVKFTPYKNQLSAFALILLKKQKPYKLQSVIYHFNFTQNNSMTVARRDINFHVDIESLKSLFQIELSLFYMPQLYNSLGISYFNQSNQKLELLLYGVQDQRALFYEYSRIQGHNFNHLYYAFLLPKISTITLIFSKQIFQMSTLKKEVNSLKTQIIVSSVLIATCLLLSSIKMFKQKIFTKNMILIELRKRKLISKIVLVLLLYTSAFVIFLSKSVNDIDISQFRYSFSSYQQKQSQYQISKSSRMVGSYFIQLFNQLFIFQMVLLIILQTIREKQYDINYFQFHIKNGLNTFAKISYSIFMVLFDSLIHSIGLVMFIYVLSHNYCDPFYEIFELNQTLIVCIIATFLGFSCSLVIAIIIANLSSNILPISIYIAIISSLHYYFSFLHGSSKISNIEYLLCILWPSLSAPAFMESVYQVNIRYIEDKIKPEIILNASFIKYFLSIGVYILIVQRILYLKRFEELTKRAEKKESSILTAISETKKITQNQQFTEKFTDYQEELSENEPILSVFIPQKMNLKHRLEKNKVLNNIRFTAQKGQILSFVDTEHESMNALMKILLNEQKSDPIINMKLLGHVTYRQKLSMSYCYEKDIYFPELTIKEHLQFYHALKKPLAIKPERESEIHNIMDQFNILEEYQNKKSKHLSGGYLKKMCLACTFIGHPTLVILQEPTLGLDLRFQRIFWNKLKQWKENKLIIMFTSNNNEAQAVSDRIWHFQKAKIYNFFQLKNRNKRMDLTLEFLGRNQYLKGKEQIDKYILETKDICKLITNDSKQIFSIQITSFKIGEESSILYLLNLITKIGELNKQDFKVHFRLQIRDCIINSQEMLKQLKKNSCNFCDRQKILEFLWEDSDFNEESKLLYRSQQSSISTDRFDDELLASLPCFDETNYRYLWVSQIQSVILHKWYLYSQQNIKMKIFVPQIIIYFYAVIIYSQQTGTFNLNFQYFNQFIIKIGMYFLLHSFIIGNQSRSGNEQPLKYYLSLGLNINNYWIGVCIFNIIVAYIPLVFSIIIVVTTFKILDFQTKIKFLQQIGFSLVYAIGYVLTSIYINLFIKNQAYVNIVLLIFLVFPIYLEQDAYFRYFDEKQDAITNYLHYFMFPWSIKQAFNGNNQPFIWLGLQIIVLSFFPIVIEALKSKYCIRYKQIFLQSNQNINNEYIIEQRNFISEIINENDYVIGENLIKIYNNSFALRNVYFRVKLGQIFGVFGHNSSGKTSLFNIIIDRLSLTSGRMKYFGKEQSLLSWRDKLNLGYCPQIDSLDASLTYEQNARVIGRLKGLTHGQINKHIEILGKYLHFEGNQQVKLCDLSISERKKSNFIIALLGLPKIFMMDEASTGVDEACSTLFLQLLKAYALQMKKAVILTSHNVKEGQKYCDRVMILKNGIIKAAGNPFDLKMGAAFQLYKAIACFSRKQSPILRYKKKEKVKLYFQNTQFKKTNFQQEYRICYGFDMNKANLISIMHALINFYSEGTIEHFSIYKYDLQEVAKYYMNQQQGELNS